MIKQWIDSYKPKNLKETEQALREIMQEVALAGLYRANFFKHAAFYGGTALRIFHGLDRFSEDLDFSLLKKDTQFELTAYFDSIVQEFQSLGVSVGVIQKNKSVTSAVDSAFLKSDTIWSELVLEYTIPQLNLNIKPSIKIKLEVDTSPPLGFDTENLLLTRPFSFYVNCFTPSNLFAGKMHALLFRKWRTRIKGRDWFDLEFYIRTGVPLNLIHFCNRANESGDWHEKEVSREQLVSLLKNRISEVDIRRVKEDVIGFVPNKEALEIWTKQYFIQLVDNIKVVP